MCFSYFAPQELSVKVSHSCRVILLRMLASLVLEDFSGAVFTCAYFQNIPQISSLCDFHYISEGIPKKNARAKDRVYADPNVSCVLTHHRTYIK